MKMTTIIVLSDPTHRVPNKKSSKRERERIKKKLSKIFCCNTLNLKAFWTRLCGGDMVPSRHAKISGPTDFSINTTLKMFTSHGPN